MSGFTANWKDKIQGLFKDFQGPKIAVFKYQSQGAGDGSSPGGSRGGAPVGVEAEI